MLGQAPASSAGFPASYPYAFSAPLPSALLRPLQQPLYDTEILPSTSTPSELLFFQRQQGQTTAFGGVAKSTAETNIQQPGQLANPLEFSLFGFTFEIEAGVTLSNFNAIYNTSVFSFLYTGSRVYLEIPLTRIPAGVAPEGFSSLSGFADADDVERTVVHNGVGHVSNFYKFTIGRSALRIRPTESFQIQLRWPNGAASLDATTTVRLRIFITGLQWTPL